jgi:glycosyl transferase family 2
MPVFNRERFVDAAIDSVLTQDFADLELLVVDDGSSDRTPELLRSWCARDPRVVVVTSSENLGIPGALNLGLQHARAPLIARFDSDDLMMPGRLAAQVAVLNGCPEVVLVSCAYDIIDVDGNYRGTWREDEPHEVVRYLLNFYNIVGGHGQVMFRRAEVLAEGGYDSRYPSSEDYDLWVRLLRRGRIVTLPLVGMKQRDHDRRSVVQYAAVKRANWTAIMGGALRDQLGRMVTAGEIAALITLWRHDGAAGMSARADRIMREALGRFCRQHPDPVLRGRVRVRTARQWLRGAEHFAAAGQRREAARYVGRAALWSMALTSAWCRQRVLATVRAHTRRQTG